MTQHRGRQLQGRLAHFCAPAPITDDDKLELGNALEICEENKHGELWASNKKGRYKTQVNFCPFCGFRAPMQCQYFFATSETSTTKKIDQDNKVIALKRKKREKQS